MLQHSRSSPSWTDLSGLVESPLVSRPPGVDRPGPGSSALDALNDGDSPCLDPVAAYVVGSVLLRARIHQALRESRFRVVGPECDGTVLGFRRAGERPSLAIVEAGDGSGDVAGLIGVIRQRAPGIPIVLAGDFGHPNWLRQPLTMADGLVQDDAPPEVLTASLDLVMLGAAALPTPLTALLVEQARTSGRSSVDHRLGFDDQRFVDLSVRRLTALERAVLCCLKKGSTNKAIARRLDLTVSAVNIAMKGILRKVGAQNRTQAALWALENLPDDERPPD